MEKAIGSIEVLGNGEVALLETMGSDAAIAEAARISYSARKSGVEKTTTPDVALIRYLMRHRHTSPFEMAEVKFYLKVPIFVIRQLIRHRTANVNEASGRYSKFLEDAYVPPLEDLGNQAKNNKQGRDVVMEITDEHMARQAIITDSIRSSYEDYDHLVNTGTSMEISRTVLPVAFYTELYWKIDLHNFFHMLKLRLDPHAQKEIRIVAQAMYDLVQPLFPLASKAFEDYVLNAKTLSVLDIHLLTQVLGGHLPDVSYAKVIGMSEREYTEFMDWLAKIRG